MNTVRVLLANQQSLFREAVRVALSGCDDLVVAAEAADGGQATEQADRTQPDVALVDAGPGRYSPGRDSWQDVVRLICGAVPTCRVIVLSEMDDERLLIEALGAGAVGYVTKQAPLADLIQAIRMVHLGNVVVPPAMLGPLISRLIGRQEERDEALRALSRLTRREREVLMLLSEGTDNQAIADELGISAQTARTHIQNILGKLDVHSRLEAAAFVVRNGVLDHLASVESRDGGGRPERGPERGPTAPEMLSSVGG